MSDDIERAAVLSKDGVYRYELTRRWSDAPLVAWVMLNPSTADADVDDPTIRRCISFTRSWDWGGIHVVNLFPVRATNPKALENHAQPFGDDNMGAVRRAIETSAFVVAAWGASVPMWGRHFQFSIMDICESLHKPLRCLGTTRNGAPRHPLYVRGDKALELWPQV